MAYWIEEINAPGKNKANQKLYYVEFLSDISHIGDGDVSYTADKSPITAAPMTYGDEALCLENSSVWVFQSNDMWKQI